eukprot:Plantae.Rhodophyta-Purpureofilum_apyrenoidigerum.ctg33145.p1 GENE.Plantae.Rhodophyta-Purpureofilum_apyrenoidigerum.ctg33145~~Plantae.Rhodophyta-Purpureofilum_apyrenoidigerum.ctg33145.p1  ORF type:complete len:302 (+),score=64.07 Plantae.Rhodophyta-Purpureofilum_apyrenoidigerum.ctg33145:146-1051(+)
MTMFGQVVVGPPGSGKSTYCAGLQQFYKGIGRACAIVNLDPANERLPYSAAVDIIDLVSAKQKAADFSLGPNGTLIYCMEYLETNMDWLFDKVNGLKGQYILFDFPGQVELFTHYTVVRSIVQQLVKKDSRITAVNLIDSHYCSDPSKYVSALMLSLTTMLQLELPHVNVLSKFDLVEDEGTLGYPIDMFLEVNGLQDIVDHLNSDPRTKKHAKLNRALVRLIENFNFVNYYPLNIQDKESVFRVAREIDKSNGYSFGTLDIQKFVYAQTSDFMRDSDWNVTVREKYVSDIEDVSDKPASK